MSTFVSVGNATQPFHRLLAEVAHLSAVLPQPVVVQHGETPFQSDNCQAIPFMDMNEFEQMVAEAELLILHAGAGSVIHAVRAGKVPVVMPRRAIHGEIVDDHQFEFAQTLANASRVVVAEEPDQLHAAVQRALVLQRAVGKTSSSSVMLKLIEETLAVYARQFPE